MDGVTSLDVVDETEVLSSFLDLDDIHETSRESSVSSDFTVNLRNARKKTNKYLFKILKLA